MTSTPNKTWDELRKRRHITVSASQIATADLCLRKWWEERVRKLVRNEDPTKFIFGSVFHSCVERFLKADDTGRDRETGKAVDIFPDGWKTDRNPFTGEVVGTVTEQDAGIIKSLIHKGIDSGVLAPYPDRHIERELRLDLGKFYSAEGFDPVRVSFMGFIDCASRNTIIDHKTTSNMRYALSPKKLAEDPQMLIYGKAWLDLLRESGENPREIVLRHNQFCKDPEKLQVRSTEKAVSASYLDKMWETRWLPLIGRMVAFRDKANKWSDLPEPVSGYRACNKYGGCGYMNICGGAVSEETLQRRLDSATKLVTLTSETKPLPLTKETPMPTLKQKMEAMKAKKAATQGSAPAKSEEPKPEPAAETKPEPVAETPDGMTPPPWAQKACGACEGVGFNTVGNPCRVCDLKAAKDKKSKNYTVTGEDDGSFVWVNKENPDDAGISPGTSYGRSEPEATQRVSEEVKEAEPEPVVEEPVVEEQKVTKAPPTKASPPPVASEGFNFTLMVNCRPLKTGKGIAKVHDFHQVLQEAKDELAHVNQADSFYDLDPFKRKDRICDAAPQIAENIGRGVLVACGIGTGMSDARALLDALKPLAKQVVVADAN